MIFLLEHDRRRGCLIEMLSYDASDRGKAEKERLDIELDLNRKAIDHEVVLLEAPNSDALLETHRRYFQSVKQIGDSLIHLLESRSAPFA